MGVQGAPSTLRGGDATMMNTSIGNGNFLKNRLFYYLN